MKSGKIKQIFVVRHCLLRSIIEITFKLLKNFSQTDSQGGINENRHYRYPIIFHQGIQLKQELLRALQRKGRDNKCSLSFVIIFNCLLQKLPTVIFGLVISIAIDRLHY